jgi:hypothetical protein
MKKQGVMGHQQVAAALYGLINHGLVHIQAHQDPLKFSARTAALKTACIVGLLHSYREGAIKNLNGVGNLHR